MTLLAGPDPVALCRPHPLVVLQVVSSVPLFHGPFIVRRLAPATHRSSVHRGDWSARDQPGALLLASPLCSSKVGLWEALFTATSAITVTGLSIIDVGADLTTAGQLVLALMILAGGLGLMAITTFLQGFVVRGTGLRRRLDRGQTLDEFGVGGVGSTFRGIALTAALVILVGALVLYSFGFSRHSRRRGAAMGLDFPQHLGLQQRRVRTLVRQPGALSRTNRVVNAVVMMLIVMGGLGWRVTSDLWSNRQRLKRKNLSLHTRLVLRTTLLLVLIGTVGLALTESLSAAR